MKNKYAHKCICYEGKKKKRFECDIFFYIFYFLSNMRYMVESFFALIIYAHCPLKWFCCAEKYIHKNTFFINK